MGKSAQPKGARRYTSSRNVYKAVKRYDHQQFDDFCTRIYQNAYQDGFTAGQSSVQGVDASKILEAIGNVKGVGPALSGKIKQAVDAQFGKKVEQEGGENNVAGN